MTNEQKLKKIRENLLAQAEDIHQFLNQDLSVSLTRKDDHILVEHTEGIDDLKFSIDRGKWHSMSWMKEHGYTDKELEGTSTKIGNANNVNSRFDVIVQKGSETAEDNLLAVTSIIAGYWDGYEAPLDNINLYKTYLGDDRIPEAIEKGCKIALMIGGFNTNMNEDDIRDRWRDKAPSLTPEIKENLELVFIMDEPVSKGFSVEKMEEIIRVGREEFGDFKYGYSHTGDHSLSDTVFAQNADFVGINLYRFYYKEADHVVKLGDKYYIETKEEFLSFAQEHIDSVREKVPDAEIVITAQTFHYKENQDKKYRPSPEKSPLWYAELIRRNKDIIAFLCYTFKDRSESYGIESYSDEYRASLKQAFVLLTKNSD